MELWWYIPKDLLTISPVYAFRTAGNKSTLGWDIGSGTSLDHEKISWHEDSPVDLSHQIVKNFNASYIFADISCVNSIDV